VRGTCTWSGGVWLCRFVCMRVRGGVWERGVLDVHRLLVKDVLWAMWHAQPTCRSHTHTGRLFCTTCVLWSHTGLPCLRVQAEKESAAIHMYAFARVSLRIRVTSLCVNMDGSAPGRGTCTCTCSCACQFPEAEYKAHAWAQVLVQVRHAYVPVQGSDLPEHHHRDKHTRTQAHAC